MNSKITTDKSLFTNGLSVIWVDVDNSSTPTISVDRRGDTSKNVSSIGYFSFGNPNFPLFLNRPYHEIRNIVKAMGGSPFYERDYHIRDLLGNTYDYGLYIVRTIGKTSTMKQIKLTASGLEKDTEVSIFKDYNDWDVKAPKSGLEILVTDTPDFEFSIDVSYNKENDTISISLDYGGFKRYYAEGTLDKTKSSFIGYVADRRIIQLRIKEDDPIFSKSFEKIKTFGKSDLFKEAGEIDLEFSKQLLERVVPRCDYSATLGEYRKELVDILYSVSVSSMIQTIIDIKSVSQKKALDIKKGALFLYSKFSTVIYGRNVYVGYSGDYVKKRLALNASGDRNISITGKLFPIERGLTHSMTYSNDELLELSDNRIVPIIESDVGALVYSDTIGSIGSFTKVDIDFWIKKELAIIQDNNRQFSDIIALANIARESERFIINCINKRFVDEDAEVRVVEEDRENGKVICTYWLGEPVEPYRQGLVKRVKEFRDDRTY